jgi:hypothetical protein
LLVIYQCKTKMHGTKIIYIYIYTIQLNRKPENIYIFC